MLRDLRAATGQLKLELLAKRSMTSTATLSRMLSGQTLPHWPLVRAVVDLLDPAADHDLWLSQYDKARAEQARQRSTSRYTTRSAVGQAPAEIMDLQGLQDALRSLILESGQSVRTVARRTLIPKSTIFDALNAPRLPHVRVVAAIAHACNTHIEPWTNAVGRLSAVARAQPEAPEPEPSPHDTVATVVAAWALPDIAALVLGLREGGNTELALHLLEGVAEQRPPRDVATLAMALLDTAAPKPGNGRHRSSIQKPPTAPPARATPEAGGPRE
ncbi:helix-turn-helix domain-containing protein [Nocardia sp. NPDC058666]|uniref:helix-turn-helix domain-containing protein n=1 Tax=Actinomycetes TaxID=1760 RepID=UPI003667C0A9